VASDTSASEEARSPSNGLSNRQTARALRAFIISSTFWGAWGRIVGIGVATFTGYALWLGATEAEIAYFVSIASFCSLAQVLSSPIFNRLHNPKRFVMLAGCLEMVLRASIVLIPFFLIENRIPALMVLLGTGLFFGFLVGPFYNGWLADIIPENIRARFIAKKTNANLIAGIVSGYAAGYYLDLFEGANQYTGFLTLFGIATVFGIIGYIRLMTVPHQGHHETRDRNENPLIAFRNKPFTRLTIFFLTWNFALGIAGPFYSVYMLNYLKISYTYVAIFNSIFMIVMVLGYKIMGGLVDRYGSRALLNILVPPTMITPVLWTFSSPDWYWLIPAAMALNGLLHAGIITSTNSLLYSSIPDSANKTTYFAAWSTAIQVAYALSPLLGSFLVDLYSPHAFELFGFTIGNIQLVFLSSGAAILVPVILLSIIEDNKSATTRELLSQIGKGNILNFVYGSLVFDRSEEESQRAKAAHRMGRSRNPMALGRLIEALDDASPEVRRQAARGLGEAKSTEALSHLLDELKDEESDIRTEAAEALGKIGDPAVIDPLIEALDDGDARVQISAIRALADIGGEEAFELLFWKFADTFNRATFPTLAEVLAQGNDLRMIKPTLQRLGNYRSPAIRLQIINSVTQTLGSGRRFYRMISMDPLERSERIAALFGRTRRSIQRSDLHGSLKTHLTEHLDRLTFLADRGDAAGMLFEALAATDTLVKEINRMEIGMLGRDVARRIGAAVLAIRTFGEERAEEEEEIAEVYLSVCLWCIGDCLKG
jgi:MFS family permease